VAFLLLHCGDESPNLLKDVASLQRRLSIFENEPGTGAYGFSCFLEKGHSFLKQRFEALKSLLLGGCVGRKLADFEEFVSEDGYALLIGREKLFVLGQNEASVSRLGAVQVQEDAIQCGYRLVAVLDPVL